MEYSLELVDLESGILKWMLELERNERKKKDNWLVADRNRKDLPIKKFCLIAACIFCLYEV
jgi:hypothetical protein